MHSTNIPFFCAFSSALFVEKSSGAADFGLCRSLSASSRFFANSSFRIFLRWSALKSGTGLSCLRVFDLSPFAEEALERADGLGAEFILGGRDEHLKEGLLSQCQMIGSSQHSLFLNANEGCIAMVRVRGFIPQDWIDLIQNVTVLACQFCAGLSCSFSTNGRFKTGRDWHNCTRQLSDNFKAETWLINN